MASTFTTGFGIEKIGSGEQSGTWGTTTNHNLDIIDRIASYKAVAITTNADTATLTVREASPGSGTENLQDGMYRVIKFTGALDSNCTVTIAPNTAPAWFIIENATTDSGSSGPYSLILSQGSGANVTVQNGKNAIIYCDGAGSGAAVVDALADLQIGTLEVTGAAAIDGALTLGGAVTGATNITLSGELDAATLDISGNADIDGTLAAGITTLSTSTTSHLLNLVSTEAGSGTGPVLEFYRNSASPASSDALGWLEFYGEEATSSDKVRYAQFGAKAYDVTNTSFDGEFLWQMALAGSLTEVLRISPIGFTFNESGADVDFRVESDGNANMLFVDGGNNKVAIGTNTSDGTLHVHTASAGSVAAASSTDDLIVENSTHGGINILTPDASYGSFAFGSPSDNHGFLVDWSYDAGVGRVHTSKVGAKLELKADNSVTQVTFDGAAGSQFAEFANDIGLKSDSSKLYFGADNEVTVTHVADVGLNFASTRSGADSIFRFSNSANASASDIRLIIQNGGTSGGDPIINLDGQATNATWSVGVDTSATKFVIADADKGGFDGSDEVFTIATGGAVSINSDAAIPLTITSTDAGAGIGPSINLHRNSASPAANDVLGGIYFNGEDAGSNATTYAYMNGYLIDPTSGGEDGALIMYVNSAGSTISALSLNGLPATGGAVFNETGADLDFRVESSGNANQLFVDAGNNRVGIGLSNPSGPLHIYDATDMKLLLDGSGSPNINLVASSGDDYLVQNHAGLFRIRNHTDNRDDISVTGAGVVSVGGGLGFNGETAAANLLDDYEEGTWTPTLTGETTAGTGQGYTSQVGRYTKIGRIVHVQIHLDMSSIGTAAGVMNVSLPITSANVGCGWALPLAQKNEVDIPSNKSWLTGYVKENSAIMLLQSHGDAVGSSALNATDLDDPFMMQFSGSYEAA